MKYLVSYDIAVDRTRNRVAKLLLNYGQRVQYSVFECDVDLKIFRKMYAELFDIVDDEEQANIRIYPLDRDVANKIMIIGDENYYRENDEEVRFI